MRDLYEVTWRQREEDGKPIEKYSRFVYATSKTRAEQTVMQMEGFSLLKRYPPRAKRIDSEDACRTACGKQRRPEHTFIEDERDYIGDEQREDGDPWGWFLSEILPELRERWKQIANEAKEKRLQLKLRFA